ncbi:hypothetical protein J437_LFUL011151 [Ladona fulva]|uniref:MOSC domain-containing protein n=1 Tax=Ladona fulva TaxID=123851 RepID=A0A8K0P198_LADFU|nr:hypothetical protein J437_LFUL011151 [Ladona fulva]
MAFFPSQKPTRPVLRSNAVFGVLDKDTGALTDATSFSLLAESSVADLNHRLEKEVSALTFRPNFVVHGTAAPYEEEQWDWIRIGETVFQNVRPCTRCLLTTVDPETGTNYKNGQPLKELKSYKQITEEKLKPFAGESPVLGIHLGLRKPGTVKIGDPVYVPF